MTEIKNTIDQNTDNLNYLKRQVELTELKIQNLKLIQDQGNLTTDEEKKGYVRQVLNWVKTGNVEAMKASLKL